MYCCSDVKPLAAEMQALFLLNPAFLLDEEAYANHGEMKEEDRESAVKADNRGGGGRPLTQFGPLIHSLIHSLIYLLVQWSFHWSINSSTHPTVFIKPPSTGHCFKPLTIDG